METQQFSIPIGFFAIWDSKRSEYHANIEDEETTSERIYQAFENAKKQGAQICGHYYCRWSAERKTFTFWVAPTINVLENAMNELYAAGDFKFAESEHILGLSAQGDDIMNYDFESLNIPERLYPFSFFAAWKWKDSYYRASDKEIDEYEQAVNKAFDYGHSLGIRMLGKFDCRFSSEWDQFTFWLSPDFESIEEVMKKLEAAGDFKFAESRHIVGFLEDGNRFGRHLQTS